jgi:hypothetical protein
MAKRPKPGKCVHCLNDPVERNWDHVFPRSWYPADSPLALAKWQIPSCIACNDKHGKIESDFISRVGLALEPDHPASRDVVERALRSMKASAGRDIRDSSMRLARGRKILAETLQGAEIPIEATIPGMGERWGRPTEEQIAVLVPAESFEMITKKIVRGIFYIEDGIFLEPPFTIDFFVLPEEATSTWADALDRFGKIYARPPGLVVRRAVSADDGRSSIFEVLFWQQFKTYACVTNSELEKNNPFPPVSV